jgi:hypothetical protein
MSLHLSLQSSHDALRECLSSLREAQRESEAIEDEGRSSVAPSGELERLVSQCQAMLRKLDQWQMRL